MYDLTHTKYIDGSDNDYEHTTVAENLSLAEMREAVKNIDAGLRHQYYVTEWDEDDEDILEQTNADEWIDYNG